MTRSTQSRGWLHTALRWHTLVFVLFNVFLAVINLAFSPSVLWFLWVTGTWGMGLIMHAFAARDDSRSSQLPTRSRSSRSRRRDANAQAKHADSDANTLAMEPESDAELGSAQTRLSVRAPASALQVGQRVADRFVIERALGAGGMGEVYLAQDVVLGERVALKTIAASSVSPAVIERFRREAQAARRITHPNVVRIHDIGQDGALNFISMEYVDGQTLAQCVEQQGQLPLAEVKRIAVQLCGALQAAHASGVVHRDLKPQNVLLDAAAQVRVIDFGLARVESSAGLTATGTVMGTPHYMAPEQLLSNSVDARTDIYALGCVLHFLITGVPPFERDSYMAIGMAHCQEPPQSLVTHRRDLSSAWDALVLRALQKQPEHRFASARQVQEALEAL